MKDIQDPIVRTCTNCMLIRLELAFITAKHGINANPVPYNCPVAKGMKDDCQAGFDKVQIKKVHHEVNFVRR